MQPTVITSSQHSTISARAGFCLAVLVAVAGMLATPLNAHASSTTLLFDGALHGANGTPATDGTYPVTFSLYSGAQAKTALWSESAKLTVAGGQFAHPLGSVKPLDAAKLSANKQLWIGVRVGQDPELPRQPLHAAMWALSAQTAQTAKTALTAKTASGLACTGCVPVSALKITDNIDLGTYSLKAAAVTAKSVAAQTVTAATFIGDGSKLTGVGAKAGACKVGQFVVGIGQDGSLQCKSAAASLPSDGLNEISNQQLTTQFAETFTIPAADVGKKIPDNTGLEVVSTIVVGDVGVAEGTVEVDVSLVNSDLSKVSVVLLPPNDKKAGVVLCDPCGKANAKVLKTTFPKPTAVKSGDLSAWQGKSPKGTWNLKVKDTGFCIPQLDKLYCDPIGGTDGQLLRWALRFGVQSSKLVGVQGTMVVGAAGSPHTAAKSLTAAQRKQAALVAGFPALWTLVVPDWASQKAVGVPGQMVYRSDLAKTFVMQGKAWREVLTTPMCGDGVRQASEVCDTTDLAGKDCAKVVGVGSKGTLQCKATCAGYDTSKCSIPPSFAGSTILDSAGKAKVNGWFGNATQQWVLCYRRSLHGASSGTFHSRCNNKGPTMTIVKNNLNYIYGGYASTSWKSASKYVYSTSTFLFSVTSNTKFPYYRNPSNAMYDNAGYGPTWGGNHDLYIANNMTTGYSNPGYSHRCPMCPNTSCTACKNALAGSYSSWKITELEVWYKK